MGLWANLHGSFTFGLAIATALGAEAFFTALPEDRSPRRALADVSSCGIWLRVHDAVRLRLDAADASGFYGQRGASLHTRMATAHIGYSRGPNMLMVLGVLFLAMFHGVRLPFWRLIMTIGLTYLMFAHVRFTALFAIVVRYCCRPRSPRNSRFCGYKTSSKRSGISLPVWSHLAAASSASLRLDPGRRRRIRRLWAVNLAEA